MPKLLNSLVVGIAVSVAASGLSPESASAQSSRRNSHVKGAVEGQSKKVKFKKNTKVDFDDELIEGGVKNPFSPMIGGRDGDNKADFIKIRKEWHDQMIMSVNGLNK